MRYGSLEVRALMRSGVQKLAKRKHLSVIILTVIAVSSFAGGMYAYKFFFTSPNGRDQSDKISVGGFAFLRAHHSDGTLYQTWEGHNTLTYAGRDVLVDCLSGYRSIGCSSMTSFIQIQNNTFIATQSANNTRLPLGCGDTDGNCFGWKTQTTFRFASGNTIERVLTERLFDPTCCSKTFDQIDISPPIVVNPGDSLNVTITFTVI